MQQTFLLSSNACFVAGLSHPSNLHAASKELVLQHGAVCLLPTVVPGARLCMDCVSSIVTA